MLFTEILKKEKTFQHIMQQSSHSAEPVSHSHLCVNRRWSKRRPMTSLQEWAVCGGEQTYSDAHLPAVAVEGLTMGCKEGPPSFFTHTCPPLESLNSYTFFFFLPSFWICVGYLQGISETENARCEWDGSLPLDLWLRSSEISVAVLNVMRR